MGKKLRKSYFKIKKTILWVKRITLLRYYVGKLSDGQFDTSEGKEPLEFTLGQGKLIAGFEKG
jgi:FKBP-type peptidyl-prolyl cis-trans isomerase